jgi:hypothetical protein
MQTTIHYQTNVKIHKRSRIYRCKNADIDEAVKFADQAHATVAPHSFRKFEVSGAGHSQQKALGP